MQTVRDYWQQQQTAIPGLHVLDNSHLDWGGIRYLLGTTLWSDTSIFQYGHCMNDYRQILSGGGAPFTPLKCWALFKQNSAWLREAIRASPLPVVVITHHLPSYQCIDAEFKNSPLNAAYASHLDALLREPNVRLWVHGHSHKASDHVVEGTRVVCNPRGYMDNEKKKKKKNGFNPNLIVHVVVANDE